MEYFWLLLNDSPYFALAAAIVATILALAVSTILSFRYLMPETQNMAKDASDLLRDDSTLASELDRDLDAAASGQTPLSPRYPDPVEYVEHIQGEYKRLKQTAAQKTIEKKLTTDQIEEEREVQRRQLAEIFKLMQDQEDRYGSQSMDEVQEQMKLYCV